MFKLHPTGDYFQNPKTQLLVSIVNEDTKTVKELIDSGVDPNIEDPHNGETALWKAIGRNNPEIVEILLKAGADPNLLGENGELPLTKAFRTGESFKYTIMQSYEWIVSTISKNFKIIEMLINSGADPYPNGYDGLPSPVLSHANRETRIFVTQTINKKKLRDLRADGSNYLSVIPKDLIGLIEKNVIIL